jgi:hypothetical protein
MTVVPIVVPPPPVLVPALAVTAIVEILTIGRIREDSCADENAKNRDHLSIHSNSLFAVNDYQPSLYGRGPKDLIPGKYIMLLT